jgi:hypothetical protein
MHLARWRGNIRGDNATIDVGRLTEDEVEGITYEEIGSSGQIVDGSDRGQLQGHPWAPNGKDNVMYSNPPGAPACIIDPWSGLHPQVGTQTGTGVWTWEGWNYLAGATRGIIAELHSTAGGDHSVQLLMSGSAGVTLDMQNNTPLEVLNQSVVASSKVLAGVWQHWAITKNGTAWAFYWNGKLEASGTGITEGDIDFAWYIGQTPEDFVPPKSMDVD